MSESRIKRINGLHGGESLVSELLPSVKSESSSESQIKWINGLRRAKSLSSIPLQSVKSASSVQICDSDNKRNFNPFT
jgi:hypothetical protein